MAYRLSGSFPGPVPTVIYSDRASHGDLQAPAGRVAIFIMILLFPSSILNSPIHGSCAITTDSEVPLAITEAFKSPSRLIRS